MIAHRPSKEVSSKAPYLLISRIGSQSLHSQWLGNSRERGFDLLLSSFDGQVRPVQGPGITFEYRPGPKVAGYGAILRKYADRIRQYRYVALFDDDLATDSASLRQLFEIADGHQVKIAQPALDHQSHFTYACLLRHSRFTLRHVNFVEMMCPFFRSDVLLDVAPLFELGFESGIDIVWSALHHRQHGDLAVIDSVPVRHTRPVGRAKAVNGFVGGRVYESDIHAILNRFGVPWLPALPYGGLRRDGTYSANRFAIGLQALRLVVAMPIGSFKFRFIAISRYWLQLVRGRPKNIDAHWPAELSEQS